MVVGIDIAERFVSIARDDAPPGAHFVRADAVRLPVREASFDAAISLCQGAFGLLAGVDEDVHLLRDVARALRPGGRLGLSAFNAYFRVRHPSAGVFDAATGVDHEVTEVRDEQGSTKTVELHTACYTPRELRLMAARAGLEVEDVWSGEPGAYARRAPDADHPELLMVARRTA